MKKKVRNSSFMMDDLLHHKLIKKISYERWLITIDFILNNIVRNIFKLSYEISSY